MKQYQLIEIINKEPLKIGSGGNKASSEPCKEFIPGSTLRGGLIAQLLQLKVITEPELPPFLQQLVCFHAYPYAEGHLFIPSPQHLRMNKHEWRRQKTRQAEHISLVNQFKNQDQESKNTLPFRLAALNEDTLMGIKVTKQYQLHHSQSLNREKQEKDNLFYYEAIAPKHTFRTIVQYDSNIADKIEKLFTQLEELYLGGSKGSGYGRCTISRIEQPLQSYQKASQLLQAGINVKKESLNTLIITCVSDCIFHDDFGQPINELPHRIIQQITGGEAELVLTESYIQAGITEGFNMKWHARYPKEATLLAGSVLKYAIKGKITSAQKEVWIKRLEEQLHGARIQEGYGWLAADVFYPEKLQIKEWSASNKKQSAIMVDQGHVEEDAKQAIAIISSGLQENKQKWLHLIGERAVALNEIVASDQLKGNHIRNMKLLIEKCSTDKSQNISLYDRQYESDNTIFSVKGSNFTAIIEFLSKKTLQDSNISQFAKLKLNGKSGKLYYGESMDLDNQRAFIADLMTTVLYAASRKGFQDA